MADPIRYQILDHAGDTALLWELPWSIRQSFGGEPVEVHARRTVAEVKPHLIELLREGHVELSADTPDAPALPLEEALAVIADDANWGPESALAPYCVYTTDSGEREFQIEHQAAGQGR